MDFVEIFLQELREKGQQSIDLIKNYLESNDSFVQGENSWITN